MSESTRQPAESASEVQFQRALQHYEGRQFDEAASLLVVILNDNPEHLPALQVLAAIRRFQGRSEESLALLQKLVDCDPNSAEARNSLANTLNVLGRKADAIEQYRAAVSLRGDFPEAYLNLGNSLSDLGSYDDAAGAYQAAIAHRSGYVEAYTKLGFVLDRLNRPVDALASFSAAASLDPQSRFGYINLGMALNNLNRHEEALSLFQRARQLHPDSPELAFNESITRLAMGDFERGLPLYEARKRIPDHRITPREFSQPTWDGRSVIAGKTMFLYAEQGLGDTILFARFIEQIVEKGARVILEVQKPLVGLMSAVPGVSQVLTASDALPDFDEHAPLGSLPLLFETTVESIPAATPYLQAPRRPDIMSGRHKSEDKRPLVGVCWAGNPDYPTDYKRSIPLSIFQRLLRRPDVRFISLQLDFRSGDDSILADFANIDLSAIRKATGMADTAALISKLDLVITVDTSIGHLAGALGRPVWILLPFYAAWMWMRDRTDSPWYPTVRLFRQDKPGDWDDVVKRVSQALHAQTSAFAT